MKKKKTRRKVLALICLTVLVLFGIVNVATAVEDNSGGGDGTGNTTPNEAYCDRYTNLRVGMRVSVVNQQGQVIGHPYDIFTKDWSKTLAGKRVGSSDPIYTLGGSTDKKVRQQVSSGTFASSSSTFEQLVTGGGSMGTVGDAHNSWWISQAISTVQTHPKDVYNYVQWLKGMLNQAIQDGGSSTGGGINVWINAILNSCGTGETYEGLLQTFNDNVPGDASFDPNDESTYPWVANSITDRYFQFEPIIFAARYCKQDDGGTKSPRWVYGTFTEVSHETMGNSWVGTYSAGIYIVDNMKKKAPEPWANSGRANSATMNINTLRDVSNGQAVGHIYLGSYIQKLNCTEDTLELFKNTYGLSEAYHEAIQQFAEGKFKGILKKPDGTEVEYTNTTPYNFDLLNRVNYQNTSVNPDGYAHCRNLPPEIETDDCDPTLAFPSVNVDPCETGNTYFRDNADEHNWLECEVAYYNVKDNGIYSSDNSGHEASDVVTFKGKSSNIVGNKEYCELFCYEDFDTRFPTSVYGVKAGQTFVWGSADGTFGEVQITKKCSNQKLNEAKNQGYLFDKWEKDYKANEKSLVTNYLEKEFNNWANTQIKVDGGVTECNTCCLAWSTCGNKKDGYYPCCVSCGTQYTATKPSYGRGNSDNNSWMSTSGSVDSPLTAKSCNDGGAGAKATVTTDTSGYQSGYESAVDNEPTLMLKIKQCTQNLKYVFETVVYFVFQEPINYAYGPNTRNFQYDDELLVQPSREDGYNKTNVDISTCHTEIVYSYSCHGSHKSANCTAERQEVLDCTQVTWDIQGNWAFRYPVDDFQWFSVKGDDTLVNGKNKPSLEDSYLYSLGFGLPTAFSLTNGEYKMKVVVGNLGDNATTKGDQDYNTDDGHFWPLTERNSHNMFGFDYECIYQVENEIFGYDCQYAGPTLTGNSPAFCDENVNDNSNGILNELDIAYRLIQLLDDTDSIDKAFPGQSGGGRERGGNWQLSESEIHDILRSDIYESLAMYELMLDVNAIQYIREDNENYFGTNIDPYTSYYDESHNLKVICKSKGTNNEYKYCASEFLTTLQTTSELNYNLMGTCLPPGMGTDARAQDVLDNGCYTTYNYPTVQWTR